MCVCLFLLCFTRAVADVCSVCVAAGRYCQLAGPFVCLVSLQRNLQENGCLENKNKKKKQKSRKTEIRAKHSIVVVAFNNFNIKK